jgi:predicted aspartyl protease
MVTLIGFLHGFAPELQGAFYRYTDDNGQLHFVDDLGLIPPRFRSESVVYSEKYDQLPVRERQRCEAEERYAALFIKKQPQRGDDDAAMANRAMETPIVIRDNQILVPVVLMHGGRQRQVNLLLDTGATTTVLYPHAARAIDVRGTRPREARSVDGQRVAAWDLSISALRLGPFRFDNVAAVLIPHTDQDLPYGGLLGIDILKQLSYMIDFSNRVIRWDATDSATDLHVSCAQP